MQNKKYLVFRIYGNCSDVQYEKLGELFNNGYVIFNEYKFADFAVIILKRKKKSDNFTFNISKEDIKVSLEKQNE